MSLQAYIYIRWSSEKQTEGDSLTRQLRDCTAFCERQGWPVVEEIRDEGRSAWKGSHLASGNLGRFATRVRDGEIPPYSVLVVEKLDRLSRDEVRKAQRWIEDICDYGIKIATVEGARVYDSQVLAGDIMHTFEILMKAKLANEESEKKSERVMSAWRAKHERARGGVVMTERCPHWLQVVGEEPNRRFEVIPDRAEVVGRIFTMAADGLGHRAIASQLNSEGVQSGHQGEVLWSATYVRDVLEGAQAEGDYLPNYRSRKRQPAIERVRGYYPRVVDADLVARARLAVQGRKGTGGRYRANFSNLFIGVGRCTRCMGNMTLHKAGRKFIEARPPGRWSAGALRCANAAQKRGCDSVGFFYYGPFEQAALNAILSDALSNRFFQKPDGVRELVVEKASIERSLADAIEAAKRLTALLSRIEAAREIEEELVRVSRERKELEGKLSSLAAQLERERGQVSPQEHLRRVSEVRDALDSSDEEERIAARMRVHAAMRDVVDAVWCDPLDVHGGVEQKTLTLVMQGAVIAHKFDNRGNLLATVDLLRDVETESITPLAMNLRNAITGDDPVQEERLLALQRRRASATCK